MGKRRHLSRRLALQILFAREFLREPPAAIVKRLEQTGEVTSKNWTPFCEDLLTHTISQLADLDTTISEVLENWRIERLSKVDRVILRLALCEMRQFEDIPLRVTLNEYVELAKEFGTEDSSSFVNGILDRLAKNFSHKDFVKAEPPDKNET